MKNQLKKLVVLAVATMMLVSSALSVSAAGLRDVFDAKHYADTYADLKAAFGNNEELLYQHFINYGLKENRQMSPIIDVQAYRKAYPDLEAAFGNNWDAYVEHFFAFGAKENRTGGVLFNPLKYAAAYPDVAAAFGSNLKAITKHFLTFGVKEGRTAGVAAKASAAAPAKSGGGSGSGSSGSGSGGGSGQQPPSGSGGGDSHPATAAAHTVANFNETDLKAGTGTCMGCAVTVEEYQKAAHGWTDDTDHTADHTWTTGSPDGTCTVCGYECKHAEITEWGTECSTCHVTTKSEFEAHELGMFNTDSGNACKADEGGCGLAGCTYDLSGFQTDCKANSEPETHADNNGDRKCDVCGEEDYAFHPTDAAQHLKADFEAADLKTGANKCKRQSEGCSVTTDDFQKAIHNKTGSTLALTDHDWHKEDNPDGICAVCGFECTNDQGNTHANAATNACDVCKKNS